MSRLYVAEETLDSRLFGWDVRKECIVYIINDSNNKSCDEITVTNSVGDPVECLVLLGIYTL